MFMETACTRPRLQFGDHPPFAKPFCQCYINGKYVLGDPSTVCVCGEDHKVNEWHWEHINDTSQGSRSSWVLLSEDKRQVTFHPCYSSGTAAIRGDTPLLLNNHYYWEIKILTQMYGTDILVGVGTQKVNLKNNRFKFKSLLGQDGESYGLSYRGEVRHNGMVSRDCEGFCRGSIVGVRLDLWRGTLEFYVNRKPQGIAFYNLRRHEALYPMISSTAAQSCLRLTYAASWRASLLVDAAKILASSVRDRNRLPPGLQYTARSQFWLTLPTDGAVVEETEAPTTYFPQLMEVMVSSSYVDGFYLDHVDRNYPVVIRE